MLIQTRCQMRTVRTITAYGVAALGAIGAVAGEVGITTQTQKLLASDGAPSDKFGFAVQREAGTLIIGAPQHYTNALPGSFYAFQRDGTGQWVEQARVFSDYQPGEAEFGDVFGQALALSGDTLLVGAPFAELDGATLVGRVYVFERQSGDWVRRQVLVPNGGAGTRFGEHIVLVGDTVVITGLSRAFVYTRDEAGIWSQQTELPAIDLDAIRNLAFDGQRIALTSDEFPTAGPQAVIFTAGEGGWGAAAPVTSSASGFLVTRGAWLCGEQLALGINDLDSPDYVFLFGPIGLGNWSQQQELTNPDPEDPYPNIHDFGAAIHGNDAAMIVGADQGNRSFVFQHEGAGEWTYAAQLRPTDAYSFAQNFGNAVHLRDNIAVVGSWAHHENGLYSGAAYVFEDVLEAIPGDIDGDRDVDLSDLALLLSSFGLCDGDAGFNAAADLDASGCVELGDLTALLSHFGA